MNGSISEVDLIFISSFGKTNVSTIKYALMTVRIADCLGDVCLDASFQIIAPSELDGTSAQSVKQKKCDRKETTRKVEKEEWKRSPVAISVHIGTA